MSESVEPAELVVKGPGKSPRQVAVLTGRPADPRRDGRFPASGPPVKELGALSGGGIGDLTPGQPQAASETLVSTTYESGTKTIPCRKPRPALNPSVAQGPETVTAIGHNARSRTSASILSCSVTWLELSRFRPGVPWHAG